MNSKLSYSKTASGAKFFSKTGILMAVVSFFGLLDSSYLASKHYSGTLPPCGLFQGCDVVTTSKFAEIGGVSVALLGAIYYLVVLLVSIIYLQTKNKKILFFLSLFVPVGFAASAWFFFVQAFVLKYFCAYCLFSAFTSTTLFVIGLATFFRLKKEIHTGVLQENPAGL
ncbi:MAG: vitamin K epoxide reductase family protein [Candidatus Paceibacter sp.]|nr:vitamin K epoxide reductase family protein [Candidatus Paceibacter sp.]